MELSAAYNRLVNNKDLFFLVTPSSLVLEHQHANMYLESLTRGEKRLSVYSGSWNPLHAGHRYIFDNIILLNNEIKLFEISLTRIGKEDLSLAELGQRISQFAGYANIVVTAVPRFIEKAGVLCDYSCRWHIGTDTISRMKNDYGEIGIAGIKGEFLVYDRQLDNSLPVQKYPLDFDIKPKNVSRALSQQPPYLLGMSSTKIRLGLKV